MAAAVIEFNALPDSVWPAAKDHDSLATFLLGGRFVLLLVTGIEVRCEGSEFSCTGIHRFVGGNHPLLYSPLSHIDLVATQQRCQLSIRETILLGYPHLLSVDGRQVADRCKLVFHFNDLQQLIEEPGINPCQFMNILE